MMITDLLDVEPEHGILGALGTRPPRRRRKWVIGALVFAVFAATLGYVTANEVQANTEFDQTRSSLGVTRQHIDNVLADLVTVRHGLDVEHGQLSADSTALAEDTSQLEAARDALADDTSRLQAAQRSLAGAQAHVSDQTSTIGDLQACLGGVEQALNALAVDDQISVINALESVSTTCASAVASNG